VAAECDRRVSTDLNGDTSVLGFGDLQRFSIELDRLDLSDSLISLVRDAQRGPDSQLAGLDIDSHNDGVLHVENIASHDFKDAWEYGLGTVLTLAFISAFLKMGFKLVEQMIDDVSGENFNTIFISECLCVWHYFNIKSKNCCKFFIDMLSLK
jgi:hypothetical protein